MSLIRRCDICGHESGCIDNGEFPITNESCNNLTIVNRILKKVITVV